MSKYLYFEDQFNRMADKVLVNLQDKKKNKKNYYWKKKLVLTDCTKPKKNKKNI